MQTYPCGHKVICRKCFVKTIQVAVTQRCLPLRCVVCRTRILKLKQMAPGRGSNSGTPSTKEGHNPSASSRSQSTGRSSQSTRQSLASKQSSRSSNRSTNSCHQIVVSRHAQQVAKDMWAHGFSVPKDSRHSTLASHTCHSTHAPHTPKSSHSTSHVNSPRSGRGVHNNKTLQHAAIATKARRTPVKQ